MDRRRKPRLEDVAQLAKVSLATVDRVFNERETVSEATRAKVFAAARALKVKRVLPDTRHGVVHIEVLLPLNGTPFYQRLNRAFQRNIAILDKRILVHRRFVPEHDEQAFVTAISSPSFPRQGLILAAPDTARVRQALLGRAQAGEAMAAVVSTVSDVPGLAYMGIDNYRAGRTAGLILGRFGRRAGGVLLLGGKQTYRDHHERIAGCRDSAALAPTLDATRAFIETRDDETLCYEAVRQALSSGLPLAGIYNSGAGSAGIEAALREHRAAGNVVWVSHEISDDHRSYLEAGLLHMVIDQDPQGQAIAALQHIMHAGHMVEDTVAPSSGADFRLYFAENCRRTPYLD
jgi:LacI family transcriptional regulator